MNDFNWCEWVIKLISLLRDFKEFSGSRWSNFGCIFHWKQKFTKWINWWEEKRIINSGHCINECSFFNQAMKFGTWNAKCEMKWMKNGISDIITYPIDTVCRLYIVHHCVQSTWNVIVMLSCSSSYPSNYMQRVSNFWRFLSLDFKQLHARYMFQSIQPIPRWHKNEEKITTRRRKKKRNRTVSSRTAHHNHRCPYQHRHW